MTPAAATIVPVTVPDPPTGAATGRNIPVGPDRSVTPRTEPGPDREQPWSLEELLDALVMTSLGPGGAYERAQVGYLVMRSGLTAAYVVCDRCRTPAMSVERMIFGHFVSAERAYRERVGAEEGGSLGLHRLGDLRPAWDAEYWMSRLGERGLL